MQLNDSVKNIKGIGDKTETMLEKLGIVSVFDLLHHYPRNYERFEEPKPISALRVGEVATIEVCLLNIVGPKRAGTVSLITCEGRDPSGSIHIVWFNQNYIASMLKPGYHFLIRGRVSKNGRKLVLEQPKLYDRKEYYALTKTLSPVYPLTKGLTGNVLKKAIRSALTQVEDYNEFLPKSVVKRYGILKEKNALEEIHFPKDEETMREARNSLVFREFMAFSVLIRSLGEEQSREANNFVMGKTEVCEKFINSLPFKLTNAQLGVWEEIEKDVAGAHMMSRLVQGDVGSGKTMLAILALLKTADHGHQGALMVPTEVLAKQHFKTFEEYLNPFGIKVALLTGSTKASERKKIYAEIESGEIQIVIGTHALLQEKVKFKELALVITDEQHRFGVKQREMLSEKGSLPHILVMSATPIPRSLALIMYGDLDISIINELPSNRLPVKNCLVGPEYHEKAYAFISKEVANGHQAFVICPMVETSESTEAENVTDYTKMLSEALPNLKIDMLHGKLPAKDKNAIMEKFASGETDVLVSTTVIEVGIDVPNATVMMIENAERFGLAALHQLRGRVGRGKDQSYCIFINGSGKPEAESRLKILRDSNDGFVIAEEDLKLRGPGDLFGVRQSGEFEFRIGDLIGDAQILKEAADAVNGLTDEEYREMLENPVIRTMQRKLENPQATI